MNRGLSLRPVLVSLRFCGTSVGSANGLVLVQSISRQINFLLGSTGDSSFAVMDSYEAAAQQLHGLLRAHPVIMLVDSLDQLADEH